MHKELKLFAFLTAIEKWNQKLNLVSYKDLNELTIKHLQDSLSLLEIFHLEEGQRILDLGSGGGFPGIPLAIMSPEAEFILLDSIGKKMTALKKISQELDLKNVTTLVGRAETLGHDPEYRESFGLVVARAVAPLPILLEYAAPFVCINGLFVAYKS
ncbi:MAG: 16S rRNA methyltransferase, partial [Candidatus Peregrinibacteria bacterium GW2011_GWE2_39_6]